MASDTNSLIPEIMSKIDKYAKFADISDIAYLFDRLVRTSDIDMQSFLLCRVLSGLKRIEKAFPMIQFARDPPSITKLSDGIRVGSLSVGGAEVPFMLSKDDLNKNILIAASVGHGKTSLVYNILSRLWQEDVTYILFDVKRDYKSLGLEDKTIYFNGLNLRINPLLPPNNVKFKEWAAHLADAFAHSFSLLIGSRDFLLDSLNKFYAAEGHGNNFSLIGLIEFLDKMPVKNEYIKVVKGRLRALSYSTDIFNHREGISLSDLDDKNVIFSIDTLGISEQGFLLAFVLSSIFYANINDPGKRNKLYKVIAIDDAHALLDSNKERDYAMGIPLLHQMISKMRELGVGFIFSDQQVSSLISSAIQNSNTKFIGRINLIGDFNSLFSFPINSEIPDMVSSLNTGEFLLLSNKIKPYGVLKADPVRIQKDIDDIFVGIATEAEPDTTGKQSISESEKVFLQEISLLPTFNTSSHLKNLSRVLSEGEFYSIKKRLSEEGFLDSVSVQTQEGKFSKFLYITEKFNSSQDDLRVQTWSKPDITKKILRDLVVQGLRRSNVSFLEDEVGILVKGLRKIYIVFMDDGSALGRLVETAFDRLIAVVDDPSREGEILKSIKSNQRARNANLGIIKFCEVYNFNLN
jgi:hypothetical protein